MSTATIRTPRGPARRGGTALTVRAPVTIATCPESPAETDRPLAHEPDSAFLRVGPEVLVEIDLRRDFSTDSVATMRPPKAVNDTI